jgi:IS5 family transposase
MKETGRLGRCYLSGRDGDAANVVLSAAGYNFRLVLLWLRVALRLLLARLGRACRPLALFMLGAPPAPRLPLRVKPAF